jgi:pimeloyl-ACP methyl ester carboxylesterase
MSHLSCIARVMASAACCMLIGSGTAAAAPKAAQAAYGHNAAVGKTVVLNGNRFYYETYGRGQALLLLHGNGGSISSFKGQIAAFARSHRVIAMDSRGQGRSALGTTALSYEMMAEDVNELLRHLQLKHVKVLGWSDGGIIGLLLAIHHPDKVGMLAVMGANLEPEGAYAWATDGDVRARARIMAALERGDDPQPLQLELQLLNLVSQQPHIPLADLHTLQAPTLVMAGDRDVIRDDHTLSIFHAIPHSQLAIFPGATHDLPVQDPPRFNRTVLEFFNKPFSMPDTKDLDWAK